MHTRFSLLCLSLALSLASLSLGACSTASPAPGAHETVVTGQEQEDAGTVADASIAPVADAAVVPGEKPEAAAPPKEACLATDIKGRLLCIPGMAVLEVVDAPDADPKRVPEGYRRFDLTFQQPVDHDHPEEAHFNQRLSLLHRLETAPLVLASSGYGLSTGRGELTRAFGANQVQVEHRFFTPSAPQTLDWQHLNIRQSAADYHRIVQALKPIYSGKWINTGASKGGMTSVYHRRFYPSDLDGTVAYVAPTVQGTEDPRFVTFLQNVGGPAYADCRNKLKQVQVAIMQHKDEMIASMTGSFAHLGGKNIALEHAVLELPFAFWQYGDPNDADSGCAAIPPASAPAADLYGFLDDAAGLSTYADGQFDYFSPYYFQAATELGAPGVDDQHLSALLSFRASYNPAQYAPKNAPIVFNLAAMTDVDGWVKTQGKSLMFIYGEFDPWSAGKYSLGAATNSFVFVAPGGNHGSKISILSSADQATAWQAIESWVGTTRLPPPSVHGKPAVEDSDDGLRYRPRL